MNAETFPPVTAGKVRQWCACKTCGRVAYYDFTPYSLESPIRSLQCGHDAGQQFAGAVVELTEKEARRRIAMDAAADSLGKTAKATAGAARATEALAAELLDFVEWAEEHRRQAKAAGERPAIDAHRVARARAALKRAGR